MEEKTNISIIIPVHELTEINETFFKNAIKSVDSQIIKPDTLLIVAASDKDLLAKLSDYDYGEMAGNVKIIENVGDTDACSQINLGVASCETEWFGFLELDDELSKNWLKNVVKYMKHDEADVFMPMIVDVDKNGSFMGFMNEAVWANEFSDEIGIIDEQALLTYQNFNMDGMVMRKDVFEDLGGLKSNIKLTFIYEFLLRVAHNGIRMMVIPKLGYKHINQRDGSLFASYVGNIDSNESKFWLEMAKKEYFYDYQREITYTK